MELPFVQMPAQPLRFTPDAVRQVVAALSEENALRVKEGEDAAAGLRVAVVGGGCAGFQYSLDFEHAARPGDVEWDEDGFHVYVDRFSYGYLEGCEVDFVSSQMGSGFKFNNPNAQTSCGCGSSFS